MQTLLPINLVNTQWSLSTQMREVAVRCPQVNFSAFSRPLTDENRRCAAEIWRLPHMHAITKRHLLLKRFDLVHQAAATPHTLAAVVMARARGGKRTRHIFTNCTGIVADDYYRNWILRSARMAHHITSVSGYAAARLREVCGREADAVIPNGIDADVYSPPDGAAPRPPHVPEQPYVLFAGAIDANKQPMFVPRLAAQRPDVLFLMAGAPGPVSCLEELQAAITGKPNVRYIGPVDRLVLRDLYRYCACFLLPSRSEGFGMAVIEAMGCGAPAIAQPVTALPEIITPGQDGWMYPVGDEQAWLRQIDEFLAWTAEERARFAVCAQQSAVRRFAWEAVAPQYERFYHSIA